MNFIKQHAISAFFLLASLSAFSQQPVVVTIQEVKKGNDSLLVCYQARISPQAISTSQRLDIIPLLQGADSVLPLPAISILGKNKQKVLSRFNQMDKACFIAASRANDSVLTYQVKVPYRQWMDSAWLVVAQELSGYRNKSTHTSIRLKGMPGMKSANVSFSNSVTPVVCITIPQEQDKMRSLQGKAYLDFQAGQSRILPRYGQNPQELVKMDHLISEILKNPEARLQKVHIRGAASVEGLYTTNERLSMERALSLKKYMQSKYNFSDDVFAVSSVGEDWQGLTELVGKSDMPEKDRILEIIANVGIHQGRESALMELDKGIPYGKMLNEMFPQLRTVNYRIDYLLKDYKFNSRCILQEKNPQELLQLKRYNLALSYDKDCEPLCKLIMETPPRYFVEDTADNGHAGVVTVTKQELDLVRQSLEKSQPAAAILNSLGIIYLLEGNLSQAETYFRMAQDAGSKEGGINLNEIRLKN